MNASHFLFWAVALPTFVITAAGCSSQDLYQVGQGWQQQECRKLPDAAERGRCEKSRALSYEKYRAEAGTNPPRTP